MSTPFPITIAGKQYLARPASLGFQNQHKDKLKKLEQGALPAAEAQDLMAAMLIHCIKRAMPDVDVATLEEDLDAVEIAQASVAIGQQTQQQVAAAYGVDRLGETKAG